MEQPHGPLLFTQTHGLLRSCCAKGLWMIEFPSPGAGVPWLFWGWGRRAHPTPAAVSWHFLHPACQSGAGEGFPGFLLWGPAPGRHPADTVWYRNSGGNGTPRLHMTSLVPGVLESPELLPGIQYFSFINVTHSASHTCPLRSRELPWVLGWG